MGSLSYGQSRAEWYARVCRWTWWLAGPPLMYAALVVSPWWWGPYGLAALIWLTDTWWSPRLQQHWEQGHMRRRASAWAQAMRERAHGSDQPTGLPTRYCWIDEQWGDHPRAERLLLLVQSTRDATGHEHWQIIRRERIAREPEVPEYLQRVFDRESAALEAEAARVYEQHLREHFAEALRPAETQELGQALWRQRGLR